MYSGCEIVHELSKCWWNPKREFGVISTKKLLPLQMRGIHPCFKIQHQYFWSGVTKSHRFLIFNRFITEQKVEVWVNSVICNSVITQGMLSLCLLLQEHVCECRSNQVFRAGAGALCEIQVEVEPELEPVVWKLAPAPIHFLRCYCYWRISHNLTATLHKIEKLMPLWCHLF